MISAVRVLTIKGALLLRPDGICLRLHILPPSPQTPILVLAHLVRVRQTLPPVLHLPRRRPQILHHVACLVELETLVVHRERHVVRPHGGGLAVSVDQVGIENVLADLPCVGDFAVEGEVLVFFRHRDCWAQVTGALGRWSRCGHFEGFFDRDIVVVLLLVQLGRFGRRGREVTAFAIGVGVGVEGLGGLLWEWLGDLLWDCFLFGSGGRPRLLVRPLRLVANVEDVWLNALKIGDLFGVEDRPVWPLLHEVPRAPSQHVDFSQRERD